MVRVGKPREGRLALSSATRGGGNRGFLWFSQANGKTWDRPHDGKFVEAGNAPLVELSSVINFPDGTLGVFAHREGERPDRQSALLCHLFVSGNNGRTWKLRSTLPDESHDLCEPAILLRDRQVTIYLRDNQRFPLPAVVLRSDDSGLTWQQLHVEDKAQAHQPAVTILKDGRAVLFYRNSDETHVGVEAWVHDPTTFQGRTLAVEDIPGSTHRYDVDTGAIEQLSDGRLLFCWSSVLKEDGSRVPEKRVELLVTRFDALENNTVPSLKDVKPDKIKTNNSR